MSLTDSGPRQGICCGDHRVVTPMDITGSLTTLPLFATVPQGLAQRWQAQYALRADAPPVAYPEFTLCILRHKRRAQDPALNWLVTMLKQAMRGQ